MPVRVTPDRCKGPCDETQEQTQMNRWTQLVLATTCAMGLAACNTMQGAGKDIERGGEKISDAAARVRADWRNARDRYDRDYDAARTGCASGTAAQRDACRDQARIAYNARMNEARITYHRREMRSESAEDRAEDVYEAARDKCSDFRNEDEDRCIASARSAYPYYRR
jgi:entericidin B